MIYTEYFVRGTEPTELCPLHGGVSIVGHLASLFGKEGQPPALGRAAGAAARTGHDASRDLGGGTAATGARLLRSDQEEETWILEPRLRPRQGQRPAAAAAAATAPTLGAGTGSKSRESRGSATFEDGTNDRGPHIVSSPPCYDRPIVAHAIQGHHRSPPQPASAVARRFAPARFRRACSLPARTGIGKRQAAVALAQALNCLSPLRDVVIRQGRRHRPHCRSMRAGSVPRAGGSRAACIRTSSLLAPEGDRVTVAIDQIRALNEQIAYRPFEGRRRVVIVDEAADVLLGPSQNAC